MNRKKKGLSTKWIVVIIVLIILGLVGGCSAWYFNTESGQRDLKTWKSNNTGGLKRTVTIYSQSGEVIKSYTGKIEIEDTEYGNKVLFELDGKRYVWYNAIVGSEEQ